MYICYHNIMICIATAWNIHRRCAAQLHEKPMELGYSSEQCLTARSKMKSSQEDDHLHFLLLPKMKFPVNVPENDVQKDCVGHVFVFSEHRMRFNNCPPKTNKFTFAICAKCQLSLCLMKERNCFYEFHHRAVGRSKYLTNIFPLYHTFHNLCVCSMLLQIFVFVNVTLCKRA